MKTAKKTWFRPFLGLFALLLIAGVRNAGAAPMTYTYTGNDFTTLGCNNDPCIQPYSSSSFLTGEITTSAPLAADLDFGPELQADVSSLSFTDGINTWDPADSSMTDFEAATDDSGNIISWNVEFVGTSAPFQFLANGTPYVLTCGDNLPGQGETCGGVTPASDQAAYLVNPNNYVSGPNSADQGTWTGSAQASPEPSSFGLMLMAALLFGGINSGLRRRSWRPGAFFC